LLEKRISNILIIGLGLIGGSFAKAVRSFDESISISALNRSEEPLNLALQENIINKKVKNIASDKYDLIVIASPLSSYQEIFSQISKDFNNKTIIIDLGSLKSFIADILPSNLKQNFIGCHPIAGKEVSGYENSESNLFENKKFIICKNSDQNEEIFEMLLDFIKNIKCDIDILDPKEHDKIFALTSHLPQFLSLLTKEFSPKNIEEEFLKAAFRLDNSNPKIWSEIFKLNEENIENYYIEFFENLANNIEKIDNDENVISPKPHQEFDGKFLKQNFAAIFFRFLVVKSYLEIKDLNKLKKYCGSGFQDFSKIINIEGHSHDELTKMILSNKDQIIKFFDKIS